MAIQVTSEADIRHMERLAQLDPFQLAPPAWLLRPQLPELGLPNTRPTRAQLEKRDIEVIMAIRFVEETAVPQRLHGRGVISGSTEYAEVVEAIRNIQPGKAIVLTLETADLLKDEKAAVKMAYSIRRHLAANGIAATAYASKKNEVVVRRDPKGAKPTPRKK